MSGAAQASTRRRATNLTLREDLVREARDRGLNLSKACEDGLERALAEARRKAWLEENRAAIAEFNAWVAENGMPFPEYRRF